MELGGGVCGVMYGPGPDGNAKGLGALEPVPVVVQGHGFWQDIDGCVCCEPTLLRCEISHTAGQGWAA